MGTTETIGNMSSNIFTLEENKTLTRGVAGEAGGYNEFTLLHYDETTGLYEKAVVTGGSETSCDAVLMYAVDADVTEGVVILEEGVRASLLDGFSALTDGEKFRIIGELKDKQIIVGDL